MKFTLSHLCDRLAISYVASSSNVLTIRPSQPSLTDCSKYIFISSIFDVVRDSAKTSSPGIQRSDSCNKRRRSRNGFSTNDSPFKYNKSKANIQTRKISHLHSIFFSFSYKKNNRTNLEL